MNIQMKPRWPCRMISVACVILPMFGGCGGSEPAEAASTANVAGNADPHKATAENLKKVHTAATGYQQKNQGQWPALEGDGGLMFPVKGMYPEYLADPRLLINPANAKVQKEVGALPVSQNTLPAFWYNGSFWYLGYAVTNEKEGLALVETIKKLRQEGKTPQGDLKVSKGKGDGGGDTIYRLREGVERFFIQDINNPAAGAVSEAQIPVMIAAPAEDGGEVLFMDGHVQFTRYPGEFPMTPAFIEALKSLDASMRKD